jgi:hypothetical protein
MWYTRAIEGSAALDYAGSEPSFFELKSFRF